MKRNLFNGGAEFGFFGLHQASRELSRPKCDVKGENDERTRPALHENHLGTDFSHDLML